MIGPRLPAKSIARSWRVWEPDDSPVRLCGVEQPRQPFRAVDVLLAVCADEEVAAADETEFIEGTARRDLRGIVGKHLLHRRTGPYHRLRPQAFGEQVIAGGATEPEIEDVYQRIADAGWALSQHTIREDEIERYLRIIEHVAAKTPVSGLRWTLEHAFEITPQQIARLKKLGVGVRVQDHDYIRNQFSAWKAGPPYRTLLESGIPIGAGMAAS